MRMLALPRIRGFLVGCFIAAMATGCAGNDPVARGKFSAFDTNVNITLIGVNRQQAEEITHVLSKDVQAMEQAWHAWIPGPVTRMNELFNIDDKPFAAPPSVLPLLRLSMDLSKRSDGLFNPAIGHLFRVWGFHGRPASCMRPPAEDLVAQLVSENPQLSDLTIDGFRVASSNPAVKLDFRDIQRGFAIDQAIARLQELGINNARIEVDGNLRAIGSRAGHPWGVTVRGPGAAGLLATVKIKGNEAAFTASSDRNAFSWEGKRFHDLIDPRTGYPANAATSVTVLHPNASTADAASAALFIAGPNDWHRVAKKMGIRYVMLTDNEGRLHMNPAMEARVKLHVRNRKVVISEPLT